MTEYEPTFYRRISSTSQKEKRITDFLYNERHVKGTNRAAYAFTEPALNWLLMGDATDGDLKRLGLGKVNAEVIWLWSSSLQRGELPTVDLQGTPTSYRNLEEVERHFVTL
jgi:hypothetical protein